MFAGCHSCRDAFCYGLHAVTKHWWKHWHYCRDAFCYGLHAVTRHWWKPWHYCRDAFCFELHAVTKHWWKPWHYCRDAFCYELHAVTKHWWKPWHYCRDAFCLWTARIRQILLDTWGCLELQTAHSRQTLVETLALLQRCILLWTACSRRLPLMFGNCV